MTGNLNDRNANRSGTLKMGSMSETVGVDTSYLAEILHVNQNVSVSQNAAAGEVSMTVPPNAYMRVQTNPA